MSHCAMSVEITPRLAVEMIIAAGRDVRGTWNKKVSIGLVLQKAQPKYAHVMSRAKEQNRASAVAWFTSEVGEFTFNRCLDELGWDREWVFKHIDRIVTGKFLESMTYNKTVTEEFKRNRTGKMRVSK